MTALPEKIGKGRVLQYALIDARCRPTGKCKHRYGFNGIPLGPAAALAICQYPDDPGYVLLYCDPHWQPFTDTWHNTLQDALNQAEFEYEGVSAVWQKLAEC